MRKVIVAALALSPMLLHAQANSPAQPKSSSSAPVLESKMIRPESLSPLSDPDHGSIASGSLRVSTGVTAPKLIKSAEIATDGDSRAYLPGLERTAVVAMVVNEKGTPSDLKIVRSIDPVMDRNILQAVSKYRYEPGSLNHQPTAVPVNLEIVIRSSDR